MSRTRPSAIGRLALVLSLFLAAPAMAATWTVDPAAGPGGDGGPARPFASVAAALDSGQVAGGDTLRLAPGDHGPLMLEKVGFDRPVTLLSDPATPAHFSRIRLKDTRNLVIDGATVWDLDGPRRHPFAVEESGRNNVLRNLDVRSLADATGYRGWDVARWLTDRRGGIRLRGRGAVAENNRITGVSEGISALGDKARISRNVIRGISADGIRALGDDSLAHGNYVADCFKVDDNHDDAFQSWSRGPDGRSGRGTVSGLVIDANTFVEWSGANPDHPLRCALQGIGLFDGMYDGIVISNNVISVSAYHGIAVAGMTNGRIVNNTVMNARGISRQAPWITIGKHRDGTPSTGNVVANNIAPRFMFKPEEKVQDLNTVTANARVIYPHADLNFDPALPPGTFVTLKPDSALKGTAEPTLAPPPAPGGRTGTVPGGTDPGAHQGAS